MTLSLPVLHTHSHVCTSPHILACINMYAYMHAHTKEKKAPSHYMIYKAGSMAYNVTAQELDHELASSAQEESSSFWVAANGHGHSSHIHSLLHTYLCQGFRARTARILDTEVCRHSFPREPQLSTAREVKAIPVVDIRGAANH